MKFTHLLRSLKSTTSSASKWKIPKKEEKKWININYEIPKMTPKQLFWRAIDAPFITYFKVIGTVTLLGTLGFGVQFYHAQYKLRTSGFALAALKTLEKFPQLTDMLGLPLKLGQVFPYVKNGIQNDEVRVRTPITGKKSSGILFYHAVKDHDVWIIRGMKFLFTDRAGGFVRLVKDVDEDE